MTFNPSNSIAPYLQTSVFFPDDFDTFRLKFLSLYRDVANIVNTKESGIYDLNEFLTAEQWTSSTDPQKKRQTYRKIFYIGIIPAGTTSTTAHGLTNITAFSHIYGTAITDVIDYRPLPYVSTTNVTAQVSLTVTSTNIVIVNGAGANHITSAIVVLEYFLN